MRVKCTSVVGADKINMPPVVLADGIEARIVGPEVQTPVFRTETEVAECLYGRGDIRPPERRPVSIDISVSSKLQHRNLAVKQAFQLLRQALQAFLRGKLLVVDSRDFVIHEPIVGNTFVTCKSLDNSGIVRFMSRNMKNSTMYWFTGFKETACSL